LTGDKKFGLGQKLGSGRIAVQSETVHLNRLSGIADLCRSRFGGRCGLVAIQSALSGCLERYLVIVAVLWTCGRSLYWQPKGV
jgi:hypothetical protein